MSPYQHATGAAASALCSPPDRVSSRGRRRPVSRVLSPARMPEDGHSSGTRVATSLARPTRTTGPETSLPDILANAWAVVPTWSCSRWGLPCRRRCRRRGALLPHPFTLTRRPAEADPGGRSALCGTFPGVAPAGCYPAPCSRGARTFLPRLTGGSGHPAVCTQNLPNPAITGSQGGNRERQAHADAVKHAIAAGRPPAALEGAPKRCRRHALRRAGVAKCGQCRPSQNRIGRRGRGQWSRQAQALHRQPIPREQLARILLAVGCYVAVRDHPVRGDPHRATSRPVSSTRAAIWGSGNGR